MAKRTNRRLKNFQTEAIALLDYMLAESYSTGKEYHYRLRIPYGPDKVELIADISVYFDGELADDDEPKKRFKVSGPDKNRQ